ncbi:MAG: hypothetical protein RIQ74_906, partial [Pseudomonadota bacterium]
YIGLFLLPSLLEILSFFDEKYAFPFWYTNPQSTVGRMIENTRFWWMILFNLIPFFLLLFIHQRFLIRMLIIWACLSGGYYVLNSWFIADYANSTVSTIILTLILIRSENSKLLRSFTQPST